MTKNFYRVAWAHEVAKRQQISMKEALEYVDEKMEEYYQENIATKEE